MQINVTTDYAIRMVLFIAIKNEAVSSKEISEMMRIPHDYVIVLSKKLKDGGIIDSARGINGGYFLAREPWNISVFDIVNIMEGTTRINRCLEEDHYCSRNAVEGCPVRKNYEQLQMIFDDTLAGVTIESLMQ